MVGMVSICPSSKPHPVVPDVDAFSANVAHVIDEKGMIDGNLSAQDFFSLVHSHVKTFFKKNHNFF